MRPFNPFCGTVSKAQLAALYGKASPNGVVIRQLSFRPPASSSATDVAASSVSRPAIAQPPEPAPTTTKSNVSVTDVSPCIVLCCRVSVPHPEERGTRVSKDEGPVCGLALRDARRWRAPQGEDWIFALPLRSQ